MIPKNALTGKDGLWEKPQSLIYETDILFIDGPFEVHIRPGYPYQTCREAFHRIQTYVATYLSGIKPENPSNSDLG